MKKIYNYFLGFGFGFGLESLPKYRLMFLPRFSKLLPADCLKPICLAILFFFFVSAIAIPLVVIQFEFGISHIIDQVIDYEMWDTYYFMMFPISSVLIILKKNGDKDTSPRN